MKIKNSELKYKLIVNRDNENDSDLPLLIEEKKEYNSLFKNDNASIFLFKVKVNTLS